MALLRTLIGLLSVIALTIAPACALSRAPMGDIAAHHQSDLGFAPPLHCGGDAEEAPDVSTALCGFFCGFFLVPSPMLVAAEFEPPKFADVVVTLNGGELRPPAPPPRG